jgi:hypothetical protein
MSVASTGTRLPRKFLTAWLLFAAATPLAQACTAEFKGAPLIDSPRYALAWRVQPAPISVGRHFAVDFVVCPKSGAALPQSLRVDAQMPEHRHGMNYKASVKAEGGGRYRAEGLMFHMAGRWELLFELRGAETERLTAEVMLK